jgi:hypothetical protein
MGEKRDDSAKSKGDAHAESKRDANAESKPIAWLVPAVIVLVGAVLVIYRLVSGPSADESQAGQNAAEGVASSVPATSDAAPGADSFDGPAESSCELGIATAADRATLDRAISDEAIVARLDSRWCGVTCADVRAFMSAPPSTDRQFDVELTTTEDWPLPPVDVLTDMAPSLTDEERHAFSAMKDVVLVHVRERRTDVHLAFRTCVAVAAALADELHGFVYDDAAHRVESAREFETHVVKKRLTDNAFRPDHIAIDSMLEASGATRMLTRGMARFGAPDIDTIDFDPVAEPRMRVVMNAVAEKIAGGARTSPIKIAGADVPVLVAEMHLAGDPDNDLVTIVPGGNDLASRRARWNELLEKIAPASALPPPSTRDR